MYYFYFKNDKNKERISTTSDFSSRLLAAKYFSTIKNMELKNFLTIFSVSK
jgi:hypothetical protein